MTYRILRTDDIAECRALHQMCMPSDDIDLGGQKWLCWDEDTNFPIGFCAARWYSHPGVIFFSRCGVLPRARGNGLQLRMLRTRLKWAGSLEAWKVITYTMYDNHASIVNLLKAGFEFYEPMTKWAGKVHYFKKEI